MDLLKERGPNLRIDVLLIHAVLCRIPHRVTRVLQPEAENGNQRRAEATQMLEQLVTSKIGDKKWPTISTKLNNSSPVKVLEYVRQGPYICLRHTYTGELEVYAVRFASLQLASICKHTYQHLRPAERIAATGRSLSVARLLRQRGGSHRCTAARYKRACTCSKTYPLLLASRFPRKELQNGVLG